MAGGRLGVMPEIRLRLKSPLLRNRRLGQNSVDGPIFMEGTRMSRHQLTDEQWELVQGFFPPSATTGRPPRDRRQVLDGILWILRTGAP